MKDYIESLLPRLSRFSKTLNDTALILEHPWVLVGVNGEKTTHIFKKNGELLIFIRGEVIRGKWEFLASMSALIVEYSGQSQLFRQAFVDPAVMILNKDNSENLFVMINQNKIPDLDILSYLNEKVYRSTSSDQSNYQLVELINPQITVRTIKMNEQPGEKGKTIQHLNGAPLSDGEYSTKLGAKITVKNGIITEYTPNENEFISFTLIGIIGIALACLVQYKCR
jgi:hypothetical protein